MKITSHKKRGFTLVELIVVIAIVAILAAVSVVSYLAFIKSANISSDTHLIKELNTVLQADEALHETRDSVHETLQAVQDNGFIVEKLTPTTSGYNIVFDRAHNRFALLDENNQKVYGDTGTREYSYSLDVWKIIHKGDELSSDFGNYLAESFELHDDTDYHISTGLDVGNHLERINVFYDGQSSIQNTIIRTQGGTLTVENEHDSVTHIGFSSVSHVEDVKNGTYVEKGTVGRLFYNDNDGAIRIENKDESVVYCYMNTSGVAAANKANVAATNANVYTWVDAGSNVASGYAALDPENLVDVAGQIVNPETCHHHNVDYEVVRFGDYQYIICKCCGAFTLFEGENTEPVESNIGTNGDPFDYSPVNLNTTYGFYNSYQDEITGNWTHVIENKYHFRNIGIYQLAHPEHDLAHATYLLKGDINFGGSSPWMAFDESELENSDEDGFYYLDSSNHTIGSFTFTGTLDGQGYKLFNAVINKSPGNKVGGSGNPDYFGLFDSVVNSTFKNFKVSQITIDSNKAAKPAGIIISGFSSNVDSGSITVEFNNVTVEDSCAILSCQAGSAFMGYCRGAGNATFINCINKANISSSYGNCGGFLGSITGNSDRNFYFENCTNEGNIVCDNATYSYIAGFIGSHSSGSYITFNKCTNKGTMTHTKVSTELGFFKAQQESVAANVKITYTDCYNSGFVKVPNPTTLKESNHIEFKEAENYKGTLTLIKYDPALGYTSESTKTDFRNLFVTGLTLEEVSISFDSSNNNTLTISVGEVTYDKISISINLGPVDKFYKSNSGWANSSGGALVTSEVVNYGEGISTRKLTHCGWIAPTSEIITGTFCDNPRNTEEVNRYHDYRVNDALKGTVGYENGYHLIDNGSYFILDNPDDELDVYGQIFKLWLKATYSVTLYNGGAPVAAGALTTSLNTDGTGTEILPYIGCYGYAA